MGLYSNDFPYSADEEYAARLAQHYDMIEMSEVIAAYRNHEGHTMIKTWRKPDFIASFTEMRIQMAQYTGMDRTAATQFTHQDLVPIMSFCGTRLAAQGHWREALWYSQYVWRFDKRIWRTPVHLLASLLKVVPYLNRLLFGTYIRYKHKE